MDMKVVSRVHTRVVYGVVPGKIVTIGFGDNPVTDEEREALGRDPSFKLHQATGHMKIVPRDAPLADTAEQSEAPLTPPVVDPRKRLEGESAGKYKARMALLDDEAATAADKAEKDAAFITDFNALSDDDKTAMYATLSDDEKALIDGQVKS